MLEGSSKTVNLAADSSDGKSAYEVWLINGHSGSVDDFLASLKGDKGDSGEEKYQEVAFENQTQVTINHLFDRFATVMILDADNKVIVADIQHGSRNQVTITFSTATSGIIVLH